MEIFIHLVPKILTYYSSYNTTKLYVCASGTIPSSLLERRKFCLLAFSI